MPIASKPIKICLAIALLSILQISTQLFVADADELNTISISSSTQYSAKIGVIEFTGEIKQGAQGSTIIKRIGITVRELKVSGGGYYTHTFFYNGSSGSYMDTWGSYFPERNWSFDNSQGGKFVISADSTSWPIGLHEVTLLALDSSDKVVATKPVQFYIGNAKEAQPTISVPNSVDIVSGVATIVGNVERNQLTYSEIVNVELKSSDGTVVKPYLYEISQEGKITITIDYTKQLRKRESVYVLVTDSGGLVAKSDDITILAEPNITRVEMKCYAPSKAISGVAFNLKCTSNFIEESSRIYINYQYLENKRWIDFSKDEYFGNSLSFGVVPSRVGIQSYRVTYEGEQSLYSGENVNSQIAPFSSNVVKVNVSKNPVTPLKVRVSYPSVVTLGKSYTANVSTSPASSGRCSYYLFNRMRILVGQSNLKNGKSSLTFPAAVAGTDAGNPATLTVVCTAGKSTGTGFIGFYWVKK